MSRPIEIAPSILSADLSRLAAEVDAVAPFSGRIHIDVMDGHFVPNLSMGPGIVSSLRPHTALPLEVHLMVEDPAMFVEPFAKAGADRIIFHAEVADDHSVVADKIRAASCSAGVALRPATPIASVLSVLSEVDLVLVMTVQPGFGGQAFMPEMLVKVAEVRQALTERGADTDIEVDGGIDPATAPRAREAGANVFVAGNAIFRSGQAGGPGAAAIELARAVGAASA